jgi:hypothetical protein
MARAIEVGKFGVLRSDLEARVHSYLRRSEDVANSLIAGGRDLWPSQMRMKTSLIDADSSQLYQDSRYGPVIDEKLPRLNRAGSLRIKYDAQRATLPWEQRYCRASVQRETASSADFLY